MKYVTVLLNDLIYKFRLSEDEIYSRLAEFSCPLNEDVEYFVKHKAVQFEKVDLARTYLIYAIDNNEPKLCGMYALATGHLELDSKLTRKQKKSFFGTTYAFGKTINTHLIGQLSKNYTNGNDKLISGDLLIELAFERIKEKNMLSPSPVIHIDCKDESKLKQFYEKMGFVYFKKNEDKDLLMYLMPMKKVKDADFTNER